MSHFKIRTPIWKTKSIGLACDKVEDENTVEITHKLASGDLMYPGKYSISGTMVKQFPKRKFNKGVAVYDVPIIILKKILKHVAQNVNLNLKSLFRGEQLSRTTLTGD